MARSVGTKAPEAASKASKAGGVTKRVKREIKRIQRMEDKETVKRMLCNVECVDGRNSKEKNAVFHRFSASLNPIAFDSLVKIALHEAGLYEKWGFGANMRSIEVSKPGDGGWVTVRAYFFPRF